MSDFRIVCTDQEPVYLPANHAHIVAVGIDLDGDGYADKKLTKLQVMNDIDNKINRYYSTDTSGREIAFVEVVPCFRCHVRIIKSRPDATTRNNLDSLRRCNWS
jgi:hypothetical protein